MIKFQLALNLLISFIFIGNVSAETSLGNIRAYIDKNYDEFVTELNFNGSIDLSKVEISHSKKELLVKIPNVKTEKKEAKLEIDDTEVKSINVTKNKKSVAISLLFSKKINAEMFKGYTKIEKDGNLVRVSLKRNSYIVQQNKLKNEILKPISLDLSDDAEKLVVTESKLDKNKIDVVKKTEDQIPVLAKTAKEVKSSESNTVSRLAMSLGVICCFGIGLLFFIKWWSKNHKSQLVQNKIKVLNQHHLGPKKSLAIIRVAGEAILIGVTDHSINHIKTLSLMDDELPDSVPASFQNELNANFEEDTVEDESFAYGTSVKDTISKRLKGLGL